MDFRVLATGYCFLEAPRVAGEHVWLTDLLLGGVHRFSPDGTIDVFLPDRHHAGGLAVNADGRIICGGPGSLSWLDPSTGKSGILLDSINSEPFTGEMPAPEASLLRARSEIAGMPVAETRFVLP